MSYLIYLWIFAFRPAFIAKCMSYYDRGCMLSLVYSYNFYSTFNRHLALQQDLAFVQDFAVVTTTMYSGSYIVTTQVIISKPGKGSTPVIIASYVPLPRTPLKGWMSFVLLILELLPSFARVPARRGAPPKGERG